MFMNSLFGESLFDDFFSDFERPMFSLMAKPQAMPKLMSTDVREKNGAYELDIDMPGFKKDDVKAELKDGYLTVSAIRKGENNEEENGKFLRRERYCGSCSRSFYVGESVSQEDIKAKFEDGILKLVVPKKEPEIPAPQYISIEG